MSYDEAVKVLVCCEYDGGLPDERAKLLEAKRVILGRRRRFQKP